MKNDDEILREEIALALLLWPNCETADCDAKQCTWADLPLCFRCGEKLVGREEMIRRFDATHDKTWAECERLEQEEKQ